MYATLIKKMFINNLKQLVLSNAIKLRNSAEDIPHKCIKNKKFSNNCGTSQVTKSGATKYPSVFSLLTSIWYETHRADVEENLAHLITLAKIALERGDMDRAQDILNLGLQISEEHKVYFGVPHLYDILAKIAISQGDLKQAQSLVTTAIEKLTMWGYADDDYNIVDFKLKLARIYCATGQETLAKIGFDNCLNYQIQKIENGDNSEKTGILYINVLFWYGVHMIKKDLYEEAKNMINIAYEYSTKIKGISVKQEMIILYTLADLNMELDDYNTALTSALNAVILCKKIGSVDTPLIYMKLGMIYEKMDFQEQAKFAYEEALKSASTFGYFDIVMDAEDALERLKNADKNDDK